MRRGSAVALFVIAACGGTTAAGVALDASTGDAGDASAADDASPPDALGFDADLRDSASMAYFTCDPPCAPDEYCLARVIRGGGRRSTGPVGPLSDGGAEASPGCHPLPPACAQMPTCACIFPAVDGSCGVAPMSDCITDDAGRPTVECIYMAP